MPRQDEPGHRSPESGGGPPAGDRRPPGGRRPPAAGQRSLGKIVRDVLLVLVIAAMGLPFLVANLGEASLTAEEEELARAARRAAYLEESLLSNSLANKTVETERLGEALRLRQHYYTFFGLRWGWSEANVSPDGRVTKLQTGLTLSELF